MAIATAFDVAGSVLKHAPNEVLSPLKLQKLVFYSFGWFAHLTGEKLFTDRFYAMEYGPVISPLLSAHSGQHDVSKDELDRHERYDLDVRDAYAAEVVDAVWSSYGRFSHSDLIEMTHCERPWETAWNDKRPPHARRSDLDADDLVAHFRNKRSARYEFAGRTVDVPVLGLLPDRRHTEVSTGAYVDMNWLDSSVPDSHITKANELRRRFMTVA